jgi:hypothetical protein
MNRKRLVFAVVAVCKVLLLSYTHAGANRWVSTRGEVGMASWYGGRFHGRETASGERFSMMQLTAAHRDLPLGTKVIVTWRGIPHAPQNLAWGRSSAPQWGHQYLRGRPHSMQNLAPSGVSTLQRGHRNNNARPNSLAIPNIPSGPARGVQRGLMANQQVT